MMTQETTAHEDYDMSDDELRRFDDAEIRQNCASCGREWHGPAANECDDCRRAGGSPSRCFQCNGAMLWKSGGSYVGAGATVAECGECDAQYPLERMRTFHLGQLVERIVAETVTGSAAEVGALILRAGRASLRRVS